MAEEDEIRLEVEAAMAVYGDDCRVIREFPPHIAIRIRPRTADDSSQQFVEAVLAIKSSREYPNEAPHVYAIETKGLDENRKTYLITSVQQKAQELSSCPMLVALCEEAVEILSSMNHPDGDCPLCLYPLVREEKNASALPFMKLIECFFRWWRWLQAQSGTNQAEEPTVTAGNQRDMHEVVNQHQGNCPVCRKVFDEKDLEHVLGYLETYSFQSGSAVSDRDEKEKALLQSESENHRRQQFEALIKLQQERNGLIEPKKDLLILPGMFLPATSVPPTTSTEVGCSEQSDVNSCSSTMETDSNSSQIKATTNNRTNLSSRRRHKGHGSRKQQHAHSVKRQWIRKEEDGSEQ
ncbi:E3 ubiquitin-protein ligase RNF25 [Ananas comosus]|uniref:E3 ubiquitin-protein ligase RNF25 n=1 Tax=Ananas comosus TaxID=4615 RepID=A0A199VMN7_ANACO|nr:E3 ubiquitin-protein ligase RNF25 [Ananas comosus]